MQCTRLTWYRRVQSLCLSVLCYMFFVSKNTTLGSTISKNGEREKKDIDTDSKHEHDALCCMCRTGLVLFCTLIGKKDKDFLNMVSKILNIGTFCTCTIFTIICLFDFCVFNFFNNDLFISCIYKCMWSVLLVEETGETTDNLYQLKYSPTCI
jgi:hypothetical protein